jgi:hypothetical protein
MVIMFLKLYINFLSILMSLNEKTQNYKVVDLLESYNFDINFIFIRQHMKELWFFKVSVLSHHSWWRDRTVLSRQHGVLAFFTSKTLSNVIDIVVPMHVARQCYLVTLATKRVKSAKKVETIIIEILNKKD